MDVEHDPFPDGKQESDIDKVGKVATLYAERNNNGSTEKRHKECRQTAWSPDGKLFVWSCGQRQVKIVSVDNIKSNTQPTNILATLDCRELVTALAFVNLESCVGCLQQMESDYRILRLEQYSEVLAVGLRNGGIRVFDVNTGNILLVLLDHTELVSHLQFLPNSNMTLLSASFDGTIKFWDLADDGNMAASFKVADYASGHGAKHKVLSVASSPDTQRLAAVGTFKTVVIMDVGNRTVLHRLYGHVNNVNCCCFGPDGVLLVTGSADTSAIVWNSHTGEIITKLGHQYPPPPEWFPGDNDTIVMDCVFTKNGTGAITVADDGFVRYWDLSLPECPAAICQVEEPLCCSLDNGGNMLAVGTAAGDVEVIQSAHNDISLASLCRIVCNNSPGIGYESIDKLLIPTTLAAFLRYDYISL